MFGSRTIAQKCMVNQYPCHVHGYKLWCFHVQHCCSLPAKVQYGNLAGRTYHFNRRFSANCPISFHCQSFWKIWKKVFCCSTRLHFYPSKSSHVLWRSKVQVERILYGISFPNDHPFNRKCPAQNLNFLDTSAGYQCNELWCDGVNFADFLQPRDCNWVCNNWLHHRQPKGPNFLLRHSHVDDMRCFPRTDNQCICLHEWRAHKGKTQRKQLWRESR